MFKMFGGKTTTKFDVFMAVAAAVVATWKAIDTVKEFNEKENEE